MTCARRGLGDGRGVTVKGLDSRPPLGVGGRMAGGGMYGGVRLAFLPAYAIVSLSAARRRLRGTAGEVQ